MLEVCTFIASFSESVNFLFLEFPEDAYLFVIL